VTSLEVIALAKLPKADRARLLDEQRRKFKDVACECVEVFMERMRVTLDDMSGHTVNRAQRRSRTAVLGRQVG
jgi:hypothetical protein